LKILFISDNFPPEVNAPASRTYDHCVEWVRAGHEVTVITCAPNFPSGKVFAGYRNRLRQVEVVDGVRVVRVWTFISANEGFALRILDYISFMVSAVIASLFEKRPDVVVGTSPQFFAACGAWLAARLKRRPFVFELRDLWPESIKAVGAMRDSFAIRLLERIEMFLYRQARLIVAVTHGFKQRLIERGIAGDKITVVTNGADLRRFGATARDPALAESLGLTGKFVVGYIGTHGMAHGLGTLLDAARLLEQDPAASNVRLLLVGAGADKKRLLEKARSMQVRNVVFVDAVPKHEVAQYWALLDISVLHLLDKDLFSTVIPSKLFESIAMSVPVLSSVPGETRGLVEAGGVGVHFHAEDPSSLAMAVINLLQNPAQVRRLRAACPSVASRYDRTALARDMLMQLQQSANGRSG
jgi:glycosyltransferase involved in cell wall biosynthesis